MEGKDHPPTPTVVAIGQINFEGNIIPLSWFRHLKVSSARPGTQPLPDLVGIVILSDIIYWYRPVEIRDEATGAVLGYRRKFKGDKLQRSYPQWADLFGLTEKQVMDAVHRLRAEGVVQTELRTVIIGQRRASNVLFVEPVPEKVKEITYRLPSYFKVPASYSEVPASYSEVGTNTETTPETKNDIIIAESLRNLTGTLPLFGEFEEPPAEQAGEARERELFLCLQGAEITPDAALLLVHEFGRQIKPNEVRAWRAYGQEQGMKNVGGFVRKMIQTGCYPMDEAWRALKRQKKAIEEWDKMPAKSEERRVEP